MKNKLTDRAVKAAKPPKKKLSDGAGLYLVIPQAGSKWWRFDYRFAGKQMTLSLGVYGPDKPQVNLAEARDRADALRRQVADGINPSDSRKTLRATNRKTLRATDKAIREAESSGRPFGEIADEWLLNRTGKSVRTNERDRRSVRYLKEGYRGTAGIGAIAVDKVILKDLFPLLRTFNAPTRVRVQAAAVKIMAYAKVAGLIAVSPFTDAKFADGFVEHTPTKRPAITDENQFGYLLRKIDAFEGRANNLTWFALKLLALTFVRPGTVQKARWQDFDLNRARWVIPFATLKMAHLRTAIGEAEEDFVVPLSRQAVGLLRDLHQITGHKEHLFPSERGNRTISESTMTLALYAMGYRGTHCAHGFRASASTILNRQRNKDGRRKFDPLLIEFQLDHKDRTVRAVYDRDDCMPERIELMQFWADKIDAMRGDNVVPMMRA
jgi:integrase